MKKITHALVSQLLLQGGNMLVFMLLARSLSIETFSYWVLFWSIFMLLDALRTNFYQQAFIAFDSTNKIKKAIMKGSGQMLWIMATAVVAFIALLFDHIIHLFDYTPEALLLFLLWGIIGLINTQLVKSEDHKAVAVNYGIYFVTLLALLWLRGSDLTNTGQVITSMSISAAILIVYRSKLLASLFKYIIFSRGRMLRKMGTFGLFNMGTGAASIIMNKADIFMISAMVSPAVVGTYAIATKIINYLEIPLTGISQYLFPQFVKAAKHEIPGLIAKSILMQLAFVIPGIILVLSFPSLLIRFVGGAAYVEEALLLLIILVLAAPFKPVGRSFGLVLTARHQVKANFVILMASMIINIALNGMLIHLFGMKGAAIATSLSVILTIGAGNYFVRNQLKISLSNITTATTAILKNQKNNLLNIKIKKSWN